MRPFRVLCVCVLASLFAGIYLLAFPSTSSPLVPTISSNTAQFLSGFALSTASTAPLLFFVPVNTGMLHMAANLRCSLRRINATSTLKHLIFWALDLDGARTLTEQGFNVYHDPQLYHVASDTNEHGDTSDYRRLMRERPKFFVDALGLGYDLLFSDADVVYFSDPVTGVAPQLSAQANDKNEEEDAPDVVFSTDNRKFYSAMADPFRDARRKGDKIPPVCNGLFWMRSGDKQIELWRDVQDLFLHPWLKHAPWNWRLDDQRAMDLLLNAGRARLVKPYPRGITEEMVRGRYDENARGKSGLKVRLLDQTEVVNGNLVLHYAQRYKDEMTRLESERRKRTAVHLNWNTRETTKEEGARSNGLSLLDDKGQCMF